MKVIIKNFNCPTCNGQEFSLSGSRRKQDEHGAYWISRKTCLNCNWKTEYNLINTIERAESLKGLKA